MATATEEKSISLSSRDDVTAALMSMLNALDKQFPAGSAQFPLGNTCAHYDASIANMEGLSRALWGLFPLLAGGGEIPLSQKYTDAIRLGTDPQSAQYWGDTGPYDQRLVEMAAYGLGLALLQDKLTRVFTPREQENLHRWLDQISGADMPDSNWNYFAIMVQLGFKRAGLPWDREVVERRFMQMEAYYLGDGWYSDGPGRPKDYYISMAFHFYGLIYATLNAEDDPDRAAVLRERARFFAQDFIYMSAADGASVPFGRSLTYRFAMVAFWSAVAFSELDILSPGEIKGVILRHLRWWLKQPIFDRDGILTLGFTYPNLAMCEDYNSPGSPYWALKVFLILALPAEHPFWQAKERALPALASTRAVPHAQQILMHSEQSQHVVMLTSGQLELNNYVNTEAKYTKFAYSSRFGFTIERGRYGIKHAACDNMLLLSENDDYFRGRRACDAVQVDADFIFSRWSPWQDVHIESWLIPCGEWHLRIHHIASGRSLSSVEGGFAVINAVPQLTDGGCLIPAMNGTSAIRCLAPAGKRQGDCIVTPPNSSIMFAECAAIPVLCGEIPVGESWLYSAVGASVNSHHTFENVPDLIVDTQQIMVANPATGKRVMIAR